MSTWLLKHATHIFAGFGSINVPHSQHKLKFKRKKKTSVNITWFNLFLLNYFQHKWIQLTFLHLFGDFLALWSYLTRCTPWLVDFSQNQFVNNQKFFNESNNVRIEQYTFLLKRNDSTRELSKSKCFYLHEAMVGAIFFQLLKCQTLNVHNAAWISNLKQKWAQCIEYGNVRLICFFL